MVIFGLFQALPVILFKLYSWAKMKRKQEKNLFSAKVPTMLKESACVPALLVDVSVLRLQHFV